MGPYLIGAAGVEDADLGRTNAATCLVLANTIRKVVVGSAERASTVVAHPRTARARRDLEADAVIRRRLHCRKGRALMRIGGSKKGGGNGEKAQEHVYKYSSLFQF